MADRAAPVALVFDLDGTLIDSAPEIQRIANKVFTDKGLEPFSYSAVRGAIGNGVGVLVSRLLQLQEQDGSGALHAEMVAMFLKIYEEAFDVTSLYPGVIGALTDLAGAGHPMGICTNKPEGPARAVLRHFKLDHLFPVVIGGDSLPFRKPDPAPLLAALTAMRCDVSLFVGDSEVDSETARAAGMPLALYTQGYRTAPVETLGAKVIFDDFRALPGLVAHFGPRMNILGQLRTSPL